MSTSSTNIRQRALGNRVIGQAGNSGVPPNYRQLVRSLHLPDYPIPTLPNSGFDGMDADDTAVGAVVFELHAPGDLREDRVVLAEPGVQARAKAPAALPHDDRAARDEI